MILILSVLILAVGLWQMISPQMWFRLTLGWKEHADSEPTGFFVVFCRLCGAFCAVVGVVGIVVFFMP